MTLLKILLVPTIASILMALTNVSFADAKKDDPVDYESPAVKKEVVEHLNVIAADVNKKSPSMIDKWVRLDRATVGPGTQLNYFYTMPALLRANSEPDIPRLGKDMTDEVTARMCGATDAAAYLQAGSVFSHSYVDGVGKPLWTIYVSKVSCYETGAWHE